MYTPDHDNYGEFQLASLNPDFLFRDKKTNKKFAVECKFRSYLNFDGMYEWSNPKQLQRYKEYNNHTPVLELLGLGEYPGSLELVSLLPISIACWPALYFDILEEFKIEPFSAFPSKEVWIRFQTLPKSNFKL